MDIDNIIIILPSGQLHISISGLADVSLIPSMVQLPPFSQPQI